MGGFLDKPQTEKSTDVVDGLGLKCASSCMQGWRKDMEDAHAAKIGLPGFDEWSYFAVFDGHNGFAAAKYCSENLMESILQTSQFQKCAGEISPDEVKAACMSAFLEIDEQMRSKSPIIEGSGTTVIAALVSPQHIYLINCGDSRALLSRSGAVHSATRDHKPSLPEERQRIMDAGGTVLAERVNGCLALSRSLGDFEYKTDSTRSADRQLVSPAPEVTVIERDRDNDQLVGSA